MKKKFEGFDGMEITDEIKVIIAVQACILLLHRETNYYPTSHTILVFPHHFYSQVKERLPGGIIAEGEQGRLGESWYQDLLNHLKHHHKSDIDVYGATNPAEFFAVVTEYFFEMPSQLKKRHPELYEQIKNFYILDTAAIMLTGKK